MRTFNIIFAITPATTVALVGNSWSFTEAPATGLTDITFPFKLANAPNERGYYFAQQFDFIDVESQGYAGLQPQANDSNGDTVVRAVFSSFQTGATTTHPNCSDGADGGTGVSCGVVVKATYDHAHDVRIKKSGSTTWSATLVDVETGTSNDIGEWTLPAGSGNIKNGQVGFVEYFPFNGRATKDCSTLPKTEAVFYNPLSDTQGAGSGRVKKPYLYGDCETGNGFSTEQVPSGWHIEVGF
ncbi:hypothetical protein CAC42_2188 [Sphaceloma murrayae]|uniref:Secreted protein n=1 Tax=Sphaceloma murrayae TaxID=2082308 RepID=A0A2K1QJ93_9PEZI|nr:hypothetical protein CAC42_2188 [Sphaceloma murrayae]